MASSLPLKLAHPVGYVDEAGSLPNHLVSDINKQTYTQTYTYIYINKYVVIQINTNINIIFIHYEYGNVKLVKS